METEFKVGENIINNWQNEVEDLRFTLEQEREARAAQVNFLIY